MFSTYYPLLAAYDLKLYSKVTLIVGLSGVQKTQMIKRIFENNPAVKKVISNLDYTPVFLTESTWHNAMESVDKKCVYFVDDEDFILEPEFIELYNKNSCCLTVSLCMEYRM